MESRSLGRRQILYITINTHICIYTSYICMSRVIGGWYPATFFKGIKRRNLWILQRFLNISYFLVCVLFKTQLARWLFSKPSLVLSGCNGCRWFLLWCEGATPLVISKRVPYFKHLEAVFFFGWLKGKLREFSSFEFSTISTQEKQGFLELHTSLIQLPIHLKSASRSSKS